MKHKKDRGHFRYATRRDLAVDLRDKYGINALHRVKIKAIAKHLKTTTRLQLIAHAAGKVQIAERARTLRRRLVGELLKTLKVDHDEINPQMLQLVQPNDRNTRKTIAYFEAREDINFFEQFRFQNGGDLRKLLHCFRFPTDNIIIRSYKFTAEEILLIA